METVTKSRRHRHAWHSSFNMETTSLHLFSPALNSQTSIAGHGLGEFSDYGLMGSLSSPYSHLGNWIFDRDHVSLHPRIFLYLSWKQLLWRCVWQASGFMHFVCIIRTFREDVGAPTCIHMSRADSPLTQNSALFPPGLLASFCNISVIRKPLDIAYCQSLPVFMPSLHQRKGFPFLQP